MTQKNFTFFILLRYTNKFSSFQIKLEYNRKKTSIAKYEGIKAPNLVVKIRKFGNFPHFNEEPSKKNP